MSIRSSIVTATWFAVLICIGAAEVADATEIKVLSVNGVKLVLGDLVGNFEHATGHKVTISFGEAGVLRKRIEEGETFDVAILPRPATDELVKQNRIASGSPVNVVRAAIGIGVRSGTPRPVNRPGIPGDSII